jgi:Putative cyclase
MTSTAPATATMQEPPYDELPLLAGTDIRQSWAVWADRTRGTLNRLTPEGRLRALAEVRDGRCIDLTLPLGEPAPPLYGRPALDHQVFARTRSMIEESLDRFDTQASSQWDSLRHFGAGRHGFYGGVAEWDSAESRAMGIDKWLEVGIVTRGVLVDLPRHWERKGTTVDPLVERSIGVEELREVLSGDGVSLARGDLLLVRTGWLARVQSDGLPSDAEEMPRGIGLSAGSDMAAFLWDAGLFAVAADNPAVEVLPGDPAVGSLHRRCLAGLGMPFGELWDFERLADEAHSSGRPTCCVVSVPLHLVGGVASPANAMALL